MEDEENSVYLTTEDLTSSNWNEKKWLWIPDPEEGYVASEVLEENGEEIKVKVVNGPERIVNINETEKMNPPKFDKVPDMADLSNLNEPSVIHNLKLRYFSNMIYSYSGLFLVSINPYCNLPIYNEEIIKSYKNMKRSDMPPHIYAISDLAYRNLLQNKENQSILITGESGAGKTENTKKVIQYLAEIAGGKIIVNETTKDISSKKLRRLSNATKTKQFIGTLEEQIIQANPILEAFGNAQTVKNNNSSRFGKFIRIEFLPSGYIGGAKIEKYLFEKSRVTYQSDKERNYHIFYQLLNGASDDIKDKLLLTGSLNDYEYIKHSKKNIDGVDDAEEFELLKESMLIMGINEEEQLNFYKIIAVVLHLGNIKLTSDRNDQALLADTIAIEKVCHLLEVSVDDFTRGLLKPKIKAGRDWVTQSKDVTQVQNSIGAFARAIYDRMFKYLITCVNKILDKSNMNSSFIGVLDIAGFEIFEKNSFEQLCINYTNEKLQQYFNHHMFIMEQEEYLREGIEWKFIDFGLDLQPTINIIEKTSPIGIFSCLDEECVMPKATDETFINKLNTLWKGKSDKYEVPRFNKGFILHHYAGKVEYDTSGWLDKNKDPLNEEITRIVANSPDKFISNLFSDYADSVGGFNNEQQKFSRIKKGLFRTFAQIHKDQLIDLMEKLNSTQPHFVRCILPNTEKKPLKFNNLLVLNQLKCNGVLEGIRICRAGFPNKITFSDFRTRYEILSKDIPKGFMDGKKVAQIILKSINLDKSRYRIGNSKVYFRAGVLAELEELRDNCLCKSVTLIQTYWRGYRIRKVFVKKLSQLRAIQVIQRNARVYVALREWSWWKLYTKVRPLLNVSRVDDEMKKKENRIKELEDKINNETEKKEKLEATQKDLEYKINELENILNSERRAAADQEEIFKRAQERIESLEEDLRITNNELENTESQFKESVQKNNDYEEELKNLKNSLDEQIIKTNKSDTEKAMKEQQIEQYKLDIEANNESIAKLQELKEKYEKEINELHENINNIENSKSELEKNKTKIQNTLTLTQQYLSEEENKNSNLHSENTNMKKELNKLKEALDETNNNKNRLEEDVNSKNKEISNLKDQMQKEMDEKEDLEKKLKDVTIKLQTSEANYLNEVSEKEKEIYQKKNLEKEINKLHELIQIKGDEESKQSEASKIRENEIQNLRIQLSDLQADYDNLRRTTNSTIEKLRLTLQDSKEDYDKLSVQKQKCDQTITELNAQNNKLNEDINNLEKDKRSLNSNLNSANNKITSLEDEIKNIQQENEKKTQQLSSLNSKIDEYDKINLNLDHDKSNLIRQNNALQNELEQEREKNENLENMNNKLKFNINDLQTRFEQEESSKLDAQHQLQLKADELELVKKNNEKEIENLTNISEAYKQKSEETMNELRDRNSVLEINNKSLEKTKVRLTAENEDLRHEIECQNNTTRTAEKKSKQLENQVSALNVALENEKKKNELAESNIRKLNLQIEMLNGNIDDKNQQINSLNNAKAEMENELQALIDEVGDGGKNVIELEKNVKRYQNEINNLKSQIEEMEETNNQLNNIKSYAENQLSEYRKKMQNELDNKDNQMNEMRKMLLKEVNDLGEQLEEVTAQKNDLMKSKKRLETELEVLTSNIDSTEKSKIDYEKSKKKAEQTIKELTAQLEAKDKECKNYIEMAKIHEQKSNNMQTELENVSNLLSSSEKSRDQLKNQVESLSKELDDNMVEIDNLYATKKALEKEIFDLKVELDNSEDKVRSLEENSGNMNADEIKTKIKQEYEDKLEKLNESRRALLAAQRLQQQDIEEKAKDIKNLENQKNILQNDIDELNSKLEEEILRRNEEESAKNKLISELNAIQDKLMNENNKNKELFDSVTFYKNKSDKYLSKLEIAELSKIKTEKAESMLKIKLRDTEDSLQNTLQEVKLLDERNKLLEKQILEIQDKMVEDSLDLNDAVTENQLIKQELADLKDKYKEDITENEEAMTELRKRFNKENQVLRNELDMERSNFIKAKEDKRKLEVELDSANDKLTKEICDRMNWTREKEKAFEKIDELTKNYMDATQVQDELRGQIESQVLEIRELKNNLEDSESKNSSIIKEKHALENEIEELNEKLSKVESQKRLYEAQCEENKTKIDELNDLYEDQNIKINEMNEKLLKAENEAAEASTRLEREKKESLDVEKDKYELEKEITNLNARLFDLENYIVPDDKKTIAKLEKKIDELTNKLEVISNEKTQYSQNVRKNERTIREMQLQLHEKTKLLEKLEEQKTKNDEKMKELKNNLSEAEITINNLKIKRHHLKKKVIDYQEKLASYESYANKNLIAPSKENDNIPENKLKPKTSESVSSSISNVTNSRMSLLGSDIDESNIPADQAGLDSNDVSMDDIRDDDEPMRLNFGSKKSSMGNVTDSQIEGEPLPPQPESN